MDLMQFYKNFNMGREVDIAGTFIYNGMKCFDKMESFDQECDIFHVLYHLAVGIERMQKVLLVLLEEFPQNISEENITNFEKSLITHSHQILQERITSKLQISFNSHQNAFLQLLTQFYETCRYDRFNISVNYHRERDLFINFLSERLNIDIIVGKAFMNTQNTNQIKKFLGRIVGVVSRTYYTQIREQSYKLGVFTHELKYDSPAYKLFWSEIKNDSFYELLFNERIALAEFFVYLLNNESEEEIRKYIDKIEPLELGFNEMEIYFHELNKGNVPSCLVDAITSCYEKLDNVCERIKTMAYISSIY